MCNFVCSLKLSNIAIGYVANIENAIFNSVKQPHSHFASWIYVFVERFAFANEPTD